MPASVAVDENDSVSPSFPDAGTVSDVITGATLLTVTVDVAVLVASSSSVTLKPIV